MEILKKQEERGRNVSPSALYYLDPMQEDNPAKFKAYLDGVLETKQTNSMMFGTAVHTYLLEQDKVVTVGDIKYPPDVIKDMLSIMLHNTSIDFDVDSLQDPDAQEFMKSHIASTGLKYGNYKPENLQKHITETYDDFYKFQKKYLGTKTILVNDQELSIVADASAGLHANPNFKLVYEQDELSEVHHEVYLKTYLSMIPDEYKAAVKLDLIKYIPSEKVIRITDLKFTSKSLRDFFMWFSSDRKGIQFGFYALREIQDAVKAYLKIPQTEEVRFEYWIACYSQSSNSAAVVMIDEMWLAQFVEQTLSVLAILTMHAEKNYWAASFGTRGNTLASLTHFYHSHKNAGDVSN